MTGKHREPEPERTWHEFTELPPRPNRQTGEPFPPSAPKYQGPASAANDNRSRDLRLIWKPNPPPDMGPVLVWHRDSVWGQVRGYFVALAILVVAMIIISLVQGGDLLLLSEWYGWSISIIGAWLMSSPLDFQTISAGADWFQRGRRKRWYQRRARLNFIKTYELVKVTGSYGGGSFDLYLEDVDGRGMHIFRFELQPDPRTWDLVYNGILHSVANGAETDKISNWLLALEETPALRLRDRNQPSG